MNLKDPNNKNHPLYLNYINARKAADVAVAKQWATWNETGSLIQFKAAHESAKAICAVAHEAEQACYDAKIAFAPYWHVTPKQMAQYDRTSKGDFS